MGKRMTLDETWKNCLSMWRWIAKQARSDKRFKVGKSPSWDTKFKLNEVIDPLKAKWLEKHGFSDVLDDCFFCHRNGGSYTADCKKCPAVKVEKGFDCSHDLHAYHYRPVKFYNKLVSLNRKRLKAKKASK